MSDDFTIEHVGLDWTTLYETPDVDVPLAPEIEARVVKAVVDEIERQFTAALTGMTPEDVARRSFMVTNESGQLFIVTPRPLESDRYEPSYRRPMGGYLVDLRFSS